jgi:hypothetical protein
MKHYNIVNPPSGIYRGDLNTGYAYFHVLLDIYARFLRDIEGFDVTCHKHSLNALGKRAELLDLNGTIEDLNNYVHNWISRTSLRDRLNISFKGEMLDCSQASMERAKQVFSQLNDLEFIHRNGETSFLDVEKISKKVNLEGIASEVLFFPERAKGEFLRLLHNNKEPIRITKNRTYAVPNPIGGENISPIFVVANMLDVHFDGEIDLITASEKELARYILLRFYSQAATSGKPGAKTILLYNKIDLEGGSGEEGDLQNLLKTDVDSDVLRYVFSKSLSFSEQKVKVNKGSLDGGRRLVYLAGNIKNFFLANGHIPLPDYSLIKEERYKQSMRNFRFIEVMSKLEEGFREISADINTEREKGQHKRLQCETFPKYISLVKKLSPFCPYITKKIFNDLGINNYSLK